MKTVKIAFGSNNLPFSIAIKVFSVSRWCHAAIVDDDHIIDATLLSGVRRIPFEEWVKHYPTHKVVEVIVPNSCDIEWAREQVGKKYDSLGIIGCYFREAIEDKDRYFCSELVARYMGITNVPLYLTPQWLHMFTRVMENYKEI